jgi:ribosomal protein S18 acetylase RimI-like enzyme
VFAVRDAGPEDIDGIAAAHIDAWRTGYRGIVPDSILDGPFIESRRAGWAARGRRLAECGPEDGLLALLQDGRAIGFAHVGPQLNDDGTPTGLGELYGFYVHPCAWGTGAATALIDAAEERLRQLGFGEAVLHVFRDNPRARRFYERAGWTFTGREAPFELEGYEIFESTYARTLI